MRDVLVLGSGLLLAAAAPAVASGIVEGAPNTRPIVMGDDARACASDSREPAMLLRIDGLKNREGYVRAELYPATQEDWLKPDRTLEAEGKPFRRVWLPVPPSGPVTLCLKTPGPGRYAFNVVHQSSPRWKFDFMRDGAGFTNNPPIRRSRPGVEQVTVDLKTGRGEATIVMNYLQGLAFRPLRRPVERLAEKGAPES